MKVNATSLNRKTDSVFDKCGKLSFVAEDETEAKVLAWLLKAAEGETIFKLAEKLDPKTGEPKT